MSKLLLDEKPLMILPQLAEKIGLNEAIILQQIHYWLLHYEKKQSQRHFRDGHWWVYNTYESWQENFPFWSVATIKRALTRLRKPAPGRDALLITTSQYNQKKYDKTLWYRIDYDALDAIEGEKPQVILTQGSFCADGRGQNDPMDEVNLTQPIPETTSETNERERENSISSSPSLDSSILSPEILPGEVDWDEDVSSALLEATIEKLSHTFHNVGGTKSNITQAYNIWDECDLEEAEFVAEVEAAAAITKAAANVKNRMPYFFAVLRKNLELE